MALPEMRLPAPVSFPVPGSTELGPPIVLLLMMIYYKVQPGWALLLWPVAVFGMVLVSMGVSMLFAAMNVRYRDVKHVIPFLIQLGLFVTPVIYPPDFLPARLRPWLALNPLSGVMEGFRACLFPHRSFDAHVVIASISVAVLLFVIGAVYFRKAERSFADII